MGTGASGNPLGVDFGMVARKPESNRIIESEAAALTSSTVVGTVAAETTASGGSIRLGAASSPVSGTLWRMQKAEGQSLFGLGRTLVTLRARVTSTASSALLANLRCGAIRNGTGTFTEVATPVAIVPSQFTAGTWRELELACNFLPDDVDQFIAVEDFTPGITDLMLDYVRVAPISRMVSHFSTGNIPCQPLNNLHQPGWTNMLIRGAVFTNASCSTAVTSTCHAWCASMCLRENMPNCSGCCGQGIYYTSGVADIMLYR